MRKGKYKNLNLALIYEEDHFCHINGLKSVMIFFLHFLKYIINKILHLATNLICVISDKHHTAMYILVQH